MISSHQLRRVVMIVALPLALSGCLEVKGLHRELAGTQAISSDGGGAGGGGGNLTPGTITLAPGAAFGLAGPAAVSMQNLSTDQDIPVALLAAADFSGPVSLSIDRSELDLIDRDVVKDIQVSAPASVMLSAGSISTVSVRVSAAAFSRSFSSSKVVLTARAGAFSASADVMLGVAPTLEVKLNGGTPPESFEAPGTIMLRTHAAGARVKFINFDSARTHIVHGEAGIAHQDTNQPLAVSVGGAPGGAYQVTFSAASNRGTARYWCHSHEGSNQAHMIAYNQDK